MGVHSGLRNTNVEIFKESRMQYLHPFMPNIYSYSLLTSSTPVLSQRNILIIAMNAMINIQEHGALYDEEVSAIRHVFLLFNLSESSLLSAVCLS
jgi:hypothetical protein